MVLVTLVSLLSASTAFGEKFDVVLKGGRVVDPETGLDAIRDVGIRADRIVRVSTEPLEGGRVIDTRGLVVAPGFIDLHQHQQDDERVDEAVPVANSEDVRKGGPLAAKSIAKLSLALLVCSGRCTDDIDLAKFRSQRYVGAAQELVRLNLFV